MFIYFSGIFEIFYKIRSLSLTLQTFIQSKLVTLLNVKLLKCSSITFQTLQTSGSLLSLMRLFQNLYLLLLNFKKLTFQSKSPFTSFFNKKETNLKQKKQNCLFTQTFLNLIALPKNSV